MKILWLTLSFILLPLVSAAATFTPEENLRRQYEEFRGEADRGGHPPLSDDRQLVEAYLVYGQRALEDGDAEAAIRHFRSGRELSPEDGRFSLLLGLAYSRLTDNELAEMHLLEARRLMPASLEPLRLLAAHYYRAGELPQAEEVLVELLRRDPEDGESGKQLEKLRREIGVEAAMTRDVNAIFSIKFDEERHEELAGRVLEILQDAYAEQGSLLNHYPRETIQVILYTRSDYDMATGAPPWSAGRFDGKIRIPVGTSRVAAADLRRVLDHEYNHFLAQKVSSGKAPAWLYEGLAMIAEGHPALFPERLAAAAASGGLIGFAELDGSFERLDHDDALLAYAQCHSFVAFLRDRFGWHVLKDLLATYGRGASTREAFASVFEGFGLDYDLLLDEWLGSL